MKQRANTTSTAEWRAVPGFEGLYEVSRDGRMRSLNRRVPYTDGRVALFRGRELRGARGEHGYLTVTLKGQRFLIHRLVASAFLPQEAGKTCVNHLNGDKRDNSAANLEWSTLADNNRHARQTGLQRQHGERNNLSRYGDQVVAAIRRVHAKYGTSYRDLALLFDISEMHAADIVKGRTRKRRTASLD